MNICLLNTSGHTGGAAIAASRLTAALEKAGVHVSLLIREDTKVNFFRFVWERFVIFICNKFSRKNLFQVSIANTGTDIRRHPLVSNADIIHIHWINQGFLSLKDIGKLIDTGKPILWTMHDLWAATGICHYPGECVKYIDFCKECPMVAEHPLWDLAKSRYLKKQSLNLSKITFVGCSNWIAKMAKDSDLLRNARFLSIPNPINTSIFKPVNKTTAKQQLHLPTDKQIVLFAAAKLSETRKGLPFLIEACSLLKERYSKEVEILLMGGHSEDFNRLFPFKVNSLGYITDMEKMVLSYSSADVFVIPSLEDNLPNTIMESMACGTPCVGFNTGGIPEMIDHKANGYVAGYKDANDLAMGITWVLENPDNLDISQSCIDKVEKNYSEKVVTEKYIQLYEKLIQNGKH